MISPDTTTVAFIGTGVMGAPMATAILNAGYDVVVYNRTKERSAELIANGARWADTVGEAVREAQVVITMLGYPEDVESVYIDEGGILESAQAGAYLIDMTTSSARLAREIHAIAAVNDLHVMDAPVSGGDVGAKTNTLTIMVGGDEGDLAAVRPVLECMGASVIYQGGAGCGQLTKMANQIALAGSMLGTVEAISFAKAAGLDPAVVLRTLSGGGAASWTLSNLAPRILNDDFKPGFFVKHFIKDMGIALDCAEEFEITLPGLEAAYQLYDLLSAVGGDELGTQALALIYSDEATCADHGLDWSLADEEDDDHDGCGCGDDDCDCDGDDCDCEDGECGCGHDHGHHHHHVREHDEHREGEGPAAWFSPFSPN